MLNQLDDDLAQSTPQSLAELLFACLMLAWKKFKAWLKRMAIRVIRFLREQAKKFDRQALLTIYRTRNDWKKGDVKNLKSYPLNPAAKKIVERISSLPTAGRSKIRPYHSHETALENFFEYIGKLLTPETRPNERMRLLKSRPIWYSFVVSGLYAWAYRNLKGTPDRSHAAEEDVSSWLHISAMQVRRYRGQFRKKLPDLEGQIVINPNDFKLWWTTGKFSLFN